MTKAELYWVAALIEGEGTIHQSKTSKSWKLQVSSTDLDILERLLIYTKMGGIYSAGPIKPRHKQAWVWALGKQDHVCVLLSILAPLFGTRRQAKALEAIDYISKHPKIRKNRSFKRGISYDKLIKEKYGKEKNRPFSFL